MLNRQQWRLHQSASAMDMQSKLNVLSEVFLSILPRFVFGRDLLNSCHFCGGGNCQPELLYQSMYCFVLI